MANQSQSQGLLFRVLPDEANPALQGNSSFRATHFIRPGRTLGVADSEVPALCIGRDLIPLFDHTKPVIEVRLHGGKIAKLEVSHLELITVMDKKLAVFNATLTDGRVYPIGRTIEVTLSSVKINWIMFANLGYHSVIGKVASDTGFLAGEVHEDLGYGMRHGLFRATADHFHLVHGAAGQTLHVHHIDNHGEMTIVSVEGPYLQSVGQRILKLRKNGHGESSSVKIRADNFPIIGTVSVMGQTNLAFWYPHDLRVDMSWSTGGNHVSEQLNPQGLFTQGELHTELVVLGDAVFDERAARGHGMLGALGLHRHIKVHVPFCMIKRGVGEAFFNLNELVSGLSASERILAIIHTMQHGQDGYVLAHVSGSGDSRARSVVLKTAL